MPAVSQKSRRQIFPTMKKNIQFIFFFLLLPLLLSAQKNNNNRIDWKSFMAEHDLIWTRLPAVLWEAPFMGNGMTGTYIVYQEEDNAIRFEICRSDVHDHRKVENNNTLFSRPRLMIGHFLLKPTGKITGWNVRTDIYNAITYGDIITNKGKIGFMSFVPSSEESGIIIETYPSGNESDTQWEWVSASPNSPRYDKFKAMGNNDRVIREYIPNPVPVVDLKNNTVLFKYLEEGETAVCWKYTDKNEHKLHISVTHSFPERNALEKAQKALASMVKQGTKRSEERRVGKECRSRWSPYH